MLSWLTLGLASLALALVIIGSFADHGIFVLVSATGLALAAIVHWRGLPLRIGYASLAAVLVFGAIRTFDAIQLFRGF